MTLFYGCHTITENHNKTLWLPNLDATKGKYYRYQMKDLDVESKNTLLFFDFHPFLLDLIVFLFY
jgi:hypothetical protein